MAALTKGRLVQPPSSHTLPSVWTLLIAGSPLLLLLLLPMGALVGRAEPATILASLGQSGTMQAVGLSLGTTCASTLGVVLFGTPLAYLLARRRSRATGLLEVLVDLPTVLPPAVAGLALLLAFGRRGVFSEVFAASGIQVAFTPLAVVMAQVFVAAPYFIKAAALGMSSVSDELAQAAALDGATPWGIFGHVLFPLARRGMAGGAALSWARALGEFGATIIFAGNLPGWTQTMPLAVYLGFEIDLGQALTLAIIMLGLSFGILIGVRALLTRRQDG